MRAPKRSRVLLDGEAVSAPYDAETGAFLVPFLEPGQLLLEIVG